MILKGPFQLSTFYHFMIFHQSWLTREVPGIWRLANVMHIYKKSWKEDEEIYRPDSRPLVPEKVMEQIILNVIRCTGQPGDQTQPAWVLQRQEGRCLTKLISFYDQVT